MKKVLFLALLFLFALLPAFSNDIANDAANEEPAKEAQESVVEFPNLTILDFTIEGLRRTKEKYLRDKLKNFLGRPASKKTLSAVETLLQAEGLFDEIKVLPEPVSETQAVVKISFKEKLSLLPLPYGYYSDGSLAVGLFLTDMNAFGVHDIWTLGGIYSKSQIMGMTAFVKPAHNVGGFGFSTSLSASKHKSTLTDATNHARLGYEAFTLGATARLLYKPTSATTIGLGGGYDLFYQIDSPWMIQSNNWYTGLSLSCGSTSWNGIFLSQNTLSVEGRLYFSDAQDFRLGETVLLSAKAQVPIQKKLRYLAGASSFLGNNLYYNHYRGRSAGAVTILPSNFSTTKIAGAYTGFEFCLVKGKYGTLSCYGFYEAAISQDWDKSAYFCHGPEAGLCVYLAKIAFPAFSMGASYNVSTGVFQYSISGGASF